MDSAGMTIDELLAAFEDDAFVLVFGAVAGEAPGRVLRWGYAQRHLPDVALHCPVPGCCGCDFYLHGPAFGITPPVTEKGLTRQAAFVHCTGTSSAADHGPVPCLKDVRVEILGRLRHA